MTAEALFRIAGAGLSHEVSIIEVTDLIDAKVEHERKVSQGVIDPVVWADWWKHNGNRFTPDKRWPLGQPFTTA